MTTPAIARTPYTALIATAAAQQSLDPDLVEAVVLKESTGRADAFRYEPAYYETYIRTNPKFAGMVPRRAASSYGLMQIMYPTAVAHGFNSEPEQLFIPAINLYWGCLHLAGLVRWAGGAERLTRFLAAYNGGQGNWNAPTPQAYAADVIKKFDALRALRAAGK